MEPSRMKNAVLAFVACAALSIPNIAAAGGPGMGPGGFTNGNPCANTLCGGGAFPPANPKPDKPNWGNFGAGLAVGLVGAAIVNNMMQPRPPQIIVQEPVGAIDYNEAHVRHCLERYNSYVIETNLYTSLSGAQMPCNSPYL